MYAGYYVPEDKKGLVNEELVKTTKGRDLDIDETKPGCCSGHH